MMSPFQTRKLLYILFSFSILSSALSGTSLATPTHEVIEAIAAAKNGQATTLPGVRAANVPNNHPVYYYNREFCVFAPNGRPNQHFAMRNDAGDLLLYYYNRTENGQHVYNVYKNAYTGPHGNVRLGSFKGFAHIQDHLNHVKGATPVSLLGNFSKYFALAENDWKFPPASVPLPNIFGKMEPGKIYYYNHENKSMIEGTHPSEAITYQIVDIDGKPELQQRIHNNEWLPVSLPPSRGLSLFLANQHDLSETLAKLPGGLL